MPQRPVGLGIKIGVEVGMIFIQQFLCPKTVKPQQPVCLVEAMLP